MVDTLDSKSGVLHGRTGSNPVRGTKEKSSSLWRAFFLGDLFVFDGVL